MAAAQRCGSDLRPGSHCHLCQRAECWPLPKPSSLSTLFLHLNRGSHFHRNATVLQPDDMGYLRQVSLLCHKSLSHSQISDTYFFILCSHLCNWALFPSMCEWPWMSLSHRMIWLLSIKITWLQKTILKSTCHMQCRHWRWSYMSKSMWLHYSHM